MGGRLGRRYATNDEDNARLKKAAQKLDDARAAVRKAKRELEAAKSPTAALTDPAAKPKETL